MKNSKYINNYRLQYWLYAVLNNSFGKAVTFERDSLHAIYEVNRHGFDVRGIPSNILLVELSFILKKAGYLMEKLSEASNKVTFTKSVLHKDLKEEHHITIYNYQSNGYVNDEYLRISPSVYFYKILK